MADRFPALLLQDEPRIVVATMPGKWLLGRTTPTWRIRDPERGFQRQVSEERARAIAAAVIDQKRCFPNAIVLATNARRRKVVRGKITVPGGMKFLVVDGQHRLWAQKFSDFDTTYCCLIHFEMSEVDMAELFVEINDNQKRVPSSLRWDLVRLVRHEDDPHGVRAVDLVFDLTTTRGGPLFQRVDLTGEQKRISLKQGSLAPQIKSLLTNSRAKLRDLGYDLQLRLLTNYFTAIRECDRDAWDDGTSQLYQARVLRALIRLLVDLIAQSEPSIEKLSARYFLGYLQKIELDSLKADQIRGKQGSAGIRAIYETIRQQVL